MRERPIERKIIDTACEIFCVGEDDLLGELRTKELVQYRYATVYVLRFLTGASYPRIGRLIGSRDHTTIIHSFRRAETDLVIGELVEELLEELESGASS